MKSSLVLGLSMLSLTGCGSPIPRDYSHINGLYTGAFIVTTDVGTENIDAQVSVDQEDHGNSIKVTSGMLSGEGSGPVSAYVILANVFVTTEDITPFTLTIPDNDCYSVAVGELYMYDGLMTGTLVAEGPCGAAHITIDVCKN